MIRAMTLADLSAVVELDATLFFHPWNAEQFHYELEENAFAHLYVIEEGQRILGYIDYWITFETAQLAKIAIAKDAQHQGQAKVLMDRMVANCEAEMCENISLEVRVNNDPAIALYTSYEFISVTTRKGYYQDGTDAFLMIKALGGNYV